MNAPVRDTVWSEAIVADLTRLWAEGFESGVIAVELFRKHGIGVSAAACLGKVHRLKLPGRRRHPPKAKIKPQTYANSGNIRKHLQSRATKWVGVETSDDPSAPTPLRLNILELTEFTCRWPIGDPLEKSFCYCGLPTNRSSYCEYHHNLAYEPAGPRSRAA